MVGILVEQIRKLLHFHACNPGELRRVGLHLREHVAEGGGRHFVTQEVLVHDCTEAHDLCLCQSQLLAEACHTCREIDQVACLGTGVLCQFVDGRSCGEHRTAKSHLLVLTEGHGQFAYLIDGILAEVVTKSHLDLVGGIHEVQNGSLGRDAEATGNTCQFVQFLPRGAGVHLLQILVQLSDGCVGQSGVLPGVGHCLFHFGIFLDCRADRHGKSGYGLKHNDNASPAVIEDLEESL